MTIPDELRGREMVRQAILLATRAHADDRWGEFPYATHLALVALEAATITQDPRAVAVAWMHDVLEDHPEYRDEVAQWFPDLVDSLTIDARRDDETYDGYIDRVLDSGDRLAIIGKCADMRVNLGNNPPPRLRERYERNMARVERAAFDLA